MLVISILRMVGPANVSTSVGTGVSGHFKLAAFGVLLRHGTITSLSKAE